MRDRDDLVFPMAEFQRRLAELRQRMIALDIDVLLTTTPENICYLTGFESPGHYYFFGLLVPLEGEPVSVSRVLEDSGVHELTWLEVRRPYAVYENPIEQVAAVLIEHGWHTARIGYEKSCWFFTAAQQEQLMANSPNATYIDCTGIIEEGRLIKSSYEINLIRRAAKAAEAGMQAAVAAIQPGVSENDVAAKIHHAMFKAGGEWPAISPFVASGYRGAIGHATWMQRVIQPGESVFLEIGGCIRRYHAAMMRTVYCTEPESHIQAAAGVIQQATQAMIDTIKPGVSIATVDHAARDITTAALGEGRQAWLAGYSIGIGFPPDWGESHILGIKPGETRQLEENMIFHLIPWVQMPGEGGISSSETVRVAAAGCERLTNFERGIIIK